MSAPALIVVNIEKISQYGYFFDMSTTFSWKKLLLLDVFCIFAALKVKINKVLDLKNQIYYEENPT